MKSSLRLTLILFLISPFAFGQSQNLEIFGTIAGVYNSKIYLFYDGNYKQKDSISAQIKEGKFYFKVTATLPIQARFHLDQQSFIQDVYIESKKTFLSCSNTIEIYGSSKDTMNKFLITKVIGSRSEDLKRNFETNFTTLQASNKRFDEKTEEYYGMLYDFISKHPKSKVSPYLLGKASMLHYSQVSDLNNLIDTSLKNTFEAKGVSKLLNSLDKTKNKAIGTAFLDVILKDTSGAIVSTKDLRGKFILVDFWASWCKPCREVNPDLKVLYSDLKEKRFEIVGVSWDKDWTKWKEAIIKDDLPWKQVIDEKGKYGDLGMHYGLEAIPDNILLNKEGKILGVGLSTKEIAELVSKTL